MVSTTPCSNISFESFDASAKVKAILFLLCHLITLVLHIPVYFRMKSRQWHIESFPLMIGLRNQAASSPGHHWGPWPI